MLATNIPGGQPPQNPASLREENVGFFLQLIALAFPSDTSPETCPEDGRVTLLLRSAVLQRNSACAILPVSHGRERTEILVTSFRIQFLFICR